MDTETDGQRQRETEKEMGGGGKRETGRKKETVGRKGEREKEGGGRKTPSSCQQDTALWGSLNLSISPLLSSSSLISPLRLAERAPFREEH